MTGAIVGIRRGADRLRAAADRVRGFVEQTLLWRIWERLLENEFVDRSVALGAKGFVSCFPFVIVAAAFVSSGVRRDIFAALLGGLHHFLSGGPAAVVFVLVSAAGSVGFWWVTSWLMLHGQVRWRALLPTGLGIGIGLSLYAASASLWMPATVDSDQHQFGLFGVSLALISWFTGAGMVILAAACAGSSLADEEGRLGQLVRGGPSALTPRASPSLPAPLRALTVGDAIGVHQRSRLSRKSRSGG